MLSFMISFKKDVQPATTFALCSNLETQFVLATAVPGKMQPSLSTTSNTIDAAGNVFSSAVYVFNSPCDLSQLRDVNLAGATLHFTSAVDVQKLKDLRLNSAKLIFNNGEKITPVL